MYIHDMVNTLKDNVVKNTINIEHFTYYTYLVVMYRTEWIACATISSFPDIISEVTNNVFIIQKNRTNFVCWKKVSLTFIFLMLLIN